jgi:hypothetical protein
VQINCGLLSCYLAWHSSLFEFLNIPIIPRVVEPSTIVPLPFRLALAATETDDALVTARRRPP